MRKQNFIQGTITLVFIGSIVKVLGLINRMVVARILTTEGVGIYMMVMPTFILLISLSQLGFPIAISKLVSENNIKKTTSNIMIVLSSLKISLINSVILIIILLLFARILAFDLLREPRTYYPLLTLIFYIPLVSFAGILKGFLNGHKIMSVPSYSQLVEQIVRIAVSISLVLILLPYGVEIAVCGAMISMTIGETSAIIYMLIRIKNKRPWNTIFSIKEEKVNPNLTKDILSISLPATGNKVIGSIAHFFEPIIFSIAMVSIGISSHYVTEIYGQIAGYTISILLVPSFFCMAVSIPLITMISEAYVHKNYKKISHYLNMSIFLSFLVGCIFTVILTLYPSELMKLFFNTTSGTVFLSYMAPIFIIHYFQLPIASALQAINKASSAMINTLIGATIKLFLVYILVSNPNVNVHGLTIAIIVNSIYVTIANFIVVSKSVKMKYNFYTIFNCISLLIITYMMGHYMKVLIPYPFLNMLILIIVYILIIYLFDIGNIRKLKTLISTRQRQA